MIVFMWRFEDCILEGLDGRVIDRDPSLMVLELMASIT